MSSDVIQLVDVRKSFGDFVAVERADFAIRGGRVLRDARTIGLRQDHDAEDDRRLRAADVRRDPAQRRRREPCPAVQAQRQHRLPAVRALPAHDRRRQRAVRADSRRRCRRRSTRRASPRCSTSCGSTDFAHRKPTQLSGGQQQRVALARALVNFPSALLLDEPLGALDLKLREAMQFELKRIQREVGITFVFVTHDQGEALTMSDRIAVMSDGRRRADRHARGDLQQPGDAVRRRLHRVGQPAARRGGRPRRRRHGRRAARVAQPCGPAPPSPHRSAPRCR